jgi:hypothetical protein
LLLVVAIFRIVAIRSKSKERIIKKFHPRDAFASLGVNVNDRQTLLLRRSERILLVGDVRAIAACGLVPVQLDERSPFLRNIALLENGLDGAFWHASLAIDALIGMDVKHRFPLVKAFDGANDNTVSVPAAVAGLADNVRHLMLLRVSVSRGQTGTKLGPSVKVD